MRGTFLFVMKYNYLLHALSLYIYVSKGLRILLFMVYLNFYVLTQLFMQIVFYLTLV
jgi:hypothetical protein